MAFFVACSDPSGIDIVSKGLQQNSNAIHLVNDKGRTGLTCAVYSGNLPTVTLLINAKANVNVVEPTRCYSPLHFAVGRNYSTIVSILLNNNANVNAIGTDGKTPLYLAVEHGYKDIITLLLGKNADTKLFTSPNTLSPLQLAKQKSNDIYQLLLSFKSSSSLDNNDEDDEDDEEDEEDEDDEDDELTDEDDNDDNNIMNNDINDTNNPFIDNMFVDSSSFNASNQSGDPLTNPKFFICGQCNQPLDNEIYQCVNGYHFLCNLCYTKRINAFNSNPIPCTNSLCSGKLGTTWTRNMNLETQLINLLQVCDQGCNRKYVPELKNYHRSFCYYGSQKCCFCSSYVQQTNVCNHIETLCLNGFIRISKFLNLIPHSHNQFKVSSSIQLLQQNSFVYLSFTIDNNPTNVYPNLIIASRVSKSKNGWELWCTFDNSSSPSLPSSLSSKFKCIFHITYEGVSYQFSIPLSPIGFIKWAFIPAVLLFNSPPPLTLNMELLGFKKSM